MKRSNTLIISALTTLVAVWGRGMLNFREESETASQPVRSGERRSHASRSASQQREQISQPHGEQRGAGTRPEAQPEESHGDRAPIAQTARQVQPRPHAEARSLDPDNAQSIDFSVVGRPCPVSECILAACKSTGGSRPSRWCAPDEKLLDDMAGEPRDEPWAATAEQAIRALVELDPRTQLPRDTTYTIRALECRTSICFLETASIVGGFGTQFYYFEKTVG